MATIYRLPGDTDDFVSVVDEGDAKPTVTGGLVPQMVYADGTMGPFRAQQLVEGFNIPPYDQITLTYYVGGNGDGKIETINFLSGVTAVGTLTLTYDSSARIVTMTFA